MKKHRSLTIPHPDRIQPRPFYGEIRWTVDSDAWLSGKSTCFEPKDGVLHVRDASTGARQDIQVGAVAEPETSPVTEPQSAGEVIDVEYREVR